MSNYLYNGVEISPLPEWDREMYPYAGFEGTGFTRTLHVSSVPFTYNGTYVIVSQTRMYRTLRGDVWDSYWGTGNGMVKLYGGCIWSNHDILNEDGSIYLAASDPVPVNPPAPIPLSITMGNIIGRVIRANWGKSQPIAYLYNGVKLPALPEWDREKCPYAHIETIWNGVKGKYQTLLELYSAEYIVSDSPGTSGITTVGKTTTSGYFKQYELSDTNTWELLIDGTIGESAQLFFDHNDGMQTVHWSNTDIVTIEGRLHLAASDPVPVYE